MGVVPQEDHRSLPRHGDVSSLVKTILSSIVLLLASFGIAFPFSTKSRRFSTVYALLHFGLELPTSSSWSTSALFLFSFIIKTIKVSSAVPPILSILTAT